MIYPFCLLPYTCERSHSPHLYPYFQKKNNVFIPFLFFIPLLPPPLTFPLPTLRFIHFVQISPLLLLSYSFHRRGYLAHQIVLYTSFPSEHLITTSFYSSSTNSSFLRQGFCFPRFTFYLPRICPPFSTADAPDFTYACYPSTLLVGIGPNFSLLGDFLLTFH